MDIFEAVKDLGVFPSALILGLLLGAVFDSGSCIGEMIPVHKAVRFLCDMLYMLFYWFCVFTLCVGAEGRLRYHIVIGAAAGAFCFHWAVGRYVRKALTELARSVGNAVKQHLVKPGTDLR